MSSVADCEVEASCERTNAYIWVHVEGRLLALLTEQEKHKYECSGNSTYSGDVHPALPKPVVRMALVQVLRHLQLRVLTQHAVSCKRVRKSLSSGHDDA